MDIRICVLLLLLAVVGSYGEFHSFGRQRRNVEWSAGYRTENYEPKGIVKRAADDKATTKSNEDTNDASSTAKSSSTTSESTKSVSEATTTTMTSASATTSSKSTDKTTKPSTEATTKSSSNKPRLDSRSAFENKDDSSSNPNDDNKKPERSSNEKEASVLPRNNPDSSANKSPLPSTSSNPAAPNSGSRPINNNPFPGYNSIPSYGPNYAFTSTNQGPGGSASASAGSFASAGGFPSNPGFPSFDSRGAFFDNSPYYNPNVYAPGNVWPTYPNKPTNDDTRDKPVTISRSNFNTDDKPATNAGPAQNPNSLPSSGPQNIPGRGLAGPYTPNFDYPAVNSVQGPNYAWTNSGPGFSASAAGAFTGTSGTPTFASRGAFSDVNTGARFPDNSPYAPDTGYALPYPAFGNFEDPFVAHQRIMEQHFRAMQAQFDAQQRAIQEANRLGNAGAGSSDPGVHSAISSISVGPRGGFQAAEISPVGIGIQSRFAEDLPAPSGGQYGVFASSSSSSMTGPDGKTVAHKSATTGVNDNGKISFRTLQD